MNKTTLFSLLLLSIISSVKAQIYTPSGTIQGATTNGNVGINATDPVSGFEVRNRLVAFKGDLNVFPTSGSGLEFFNQTGTSFIQSYDRAGSLYNHLNIRGNNITFTPSGRVDIITGISGPSFNIPNQAFGSISFCNGSTPNTVPTIIGKSNNSIGLSFGAATNDVNTFPDMQFNVRKNDNTDYTTLTSTAFRFSRYGTSLVDILRNGTVQVQTSDARLMGGNNLGRLVVSNATTTAYLEVKGNTNVNPDNVNLVSSVGTINLITNALNRLIVLNNGNVGIGSVAPDSKLTVKGKIHTEEVKVDLAVPADYVFEKYYLGESSLKPEYTLLTLSEVEKFTEENHHLPNVPSAKEIKENGLLLGEMSNILLQKIEELTLYSIDQKKTIEKQATAIEKLEKENKSVKNLEERLNRLEKELETKKSTSSN